MTYDPDKPDSDDPSIALSPQKRNLARPESPPVRFPIALALATGVGAVLACLVAAVLGLLGAGRPAP